METLFRTYSSGRWRKAMDKLLPHTTSYTQGVEETH